LSEAEGSPDTNSIAYIDTLLQYYLHIADPSVLSNEEWAMKWAILQHIRQEEAKSISI
jgi:hypothetical protein